MRDDGKMSVMMNQLIQVLILSFLSSFAESTQGSDNQVCQHTRNNRPRGPCLHHDDALCIQSGHWHFLFGREVEKLDSGVEAENHAAPWG